MTLIIAEAGVNHNGDIGLAKELIDIASECGADIVKFQTFKAEDLVTNRAKKAAYQKKSVSGPSDQLSMLKKLELSDHDFEVLRDHCQKRSIEFLSTAFTIESLEFLVSLGIKRIKIPSGEITNFPLLLKSSTFGLPIILSSGLSYMSEIERAVNSSASDSIMDLYDSINNSINKRLREFLIAVLIMESFMIGVFCSLDLVVFYLFFEAGLIPMFLIIGIWGGERRIYASFKFFLYTLLGSVLMLVAIIIIYRNSTRILYNLEWEMFCLFAYYLFGHWQPASDH